jgi:hypothetical protein
MFPCLHGEPAKCLEFSLRDCFFHRFQTPWYDVLRPVLYRVMCCIVQTEEIKEHAYEGNERGLAMMSASWPPFPLYC